MTRGWLDQARKSGQPIGPGAADGTFAAGVNHVTELLPSLMTDIINTAPEAQKVRFRDVSLITITRLDYMNVDKTAHECSLLSCRYKKIAPYFSCISETHVFLCILGQTEEAH